MNNRLNGLSRADRLRNAPARKLARAIGLVLIAIIGATLIALTLAEAVFLIVNAYDLALNWKD